MKREINTNIGLQEEIIFAPHEPYDFNTSLPRLTFLESWAGARIYFWLISIRGALEIYKSGNAGAKGGGTGGGGQGGTCPPKKFPTPKKCPFF